MEAVAVNQILVKLLLLALNLVPVDQAGFNFHVMQDGVYAATFGKKTLHLRISAYRSALLRQMRREDALSKMGKNRMQNCLLLT